MLDVAWPELVVIGTVALVAIGPKDLPKVMRALGNLIGKLRRMAGDLQRTFEQLSLEADAAERAKQAMAQEPAPEKPVSEKSGGTDHV